ncbi:SIR2 family protein [Bradyrhizobium sp. SZCCHNS3051]|uniref:SIR2 family protein n=1 Tax=Bradyrhizobium sp. SZCCHNS3051 TaxID=3057320 RepID=UPI0029164365|nr:SIR2 family protein [Bradyrhizobium sp. SZCCHNS3051]
MQKDAEDFVGKYLKELKENNAAVFVGAGLSRAAGYVDWPGLMSPIASDLGLDATKETDLVALAQYHLNTNATNRHQLNQLLIDEFSDLKGPTENHTLLARLPIQTYWTTNYDRLIEAALEAGGRRVDAKYTNEQLAITRRGRDAVIYKMHGDIEHPDKAVLSKDDYERYHSTHAPFVTALLGDLVEKTFLFLGFSFSDPNLDFILSRIRSRFTQHQRQHYCIAKRRSRQSKESKAEFDYALIKQELLLQDLLRFNIKTILVDEFSEIAELLRTIEHRYRRRSVFISGSAADYGSWGQSATGEFMAKLARALIEKDLRITSGFGLGIGEAVVTGAVQQIYSTRQRSIEEQLMLRPFPIGISDPQERDRTFKRYRNELVEQAGIAIFVMGNKNVGGKIVQADGVRAEFELAKAKGLYLIPIGSSGSAASELWNEVTSQIDVFFPRNTRTIRPLLKAIGRPVKDPNDLLEPLLKLIDCLAKE